MANEYSRKNLPFVKLLFETNKYYDAMMTRFTTFKNDSTRARSFADGTADARLAPIKETFTTYIESQLPLLIDAIRKMQEEAQKIIEDTRKDDYRNSSEILQQLRTAYRSYAEFLKTMTIVCKGFNSNFYKLIIELSKILSEYQQNINNYKSTSDRKFPNKASAEKNPSELTLSMQLGNQYCRLLKESFEKHKSRIEDLQRLQQDTTIERNVYMSGEINIIKSLIYTYQSIMDESKALFAKANTDVALAQARQVVSKMLNDFKQYKTLVTDLYNAFNDFTQYKEPLENSMIYFMHAERVLMKLQTLKPGEKLDERQIFDEMIRENSKNIDHLQRSIASLQNALSKTRKDDASKDDTHKLDTPKSDPTDKFKSMILHHQQTVVNLQSYNVTISQQKVEYLIKEYNLGRNIDRENAINRLISERENLSEEKKRCEESLKTFPDNEYLINLIRRINKQVRTIESAIKAHAVSSSLAPSVKLDSQKREEPAPKQQKAG